MDKQRWRYFWRRASVALTLLPITLLVVELQTRMLTPQELDSQLDIFAPDTVIGFTFLPNAQGLEVGREYRAAYNINSDGLHDREYGEKRANDFRVLLLGDSFSVSHGLAIEDSLSRQLETSMNELMADQDTNVQVINAAVGGYSPYNYWRAFEKWNDVYDPDAVVVGLAPDDYDTSNERAVYDIRNGEILAMNREGTSNQQTQRAGFSDAYRGITHRIRKLLSRSSHTYVLLRNFLYYNPFMDSLKVLLRGGPESVTGQTVQYVPELSTDLWDSTMAYIERLHEAASREGIPLLIIRIPLKAEVDADELARTISQQPGIEDKLDMDLPRRTLLSFAQEEGIPFLDPRPALLSAHNRRRAYFVHDGHWNERGVRAAARSLAEQWQAQGVPPWD